MHQKNSHQITCGALARQGSTPPNKGVAADERAFVPVLKWFRSRAGVRAEHRSMRSSRPARLLAW
jgi:hypothetical protein